MIERMCETLDDAALVALIEERTRAEAAVGAERLAAIAELTRRRIDAADEETNRWVSDPWAAASAEVSAAMGIGSRAASKEMCIALALRDRLPKVAALYAEGKLGSRVVSTITWRTRLVVGSDVLARIDTDIVAGATHWGGLSGEGLEQAVDIVVDRHDPAAVIKSRVAARQRDVSVGCPDDPGALGSVWGRLFATDAALLKRRLDQMAGGVCDSDPRNAGQRRADALGALAAGAAVLACQCGNSDCPQAVRDARADSVVIHVVADAAAVEQAKCEPLAAGEPIDVAVQADPAATVPGAKPAAEPGRPTVAALMIGGGVIPTSLLGELLRIGAKVTTVAPPQDAEPRYRPTTALDRFVRVRDQVCRFPGCTRAAVYADVDHTVAHPDGATHASNLKCLCREHHLLKTFWSGRGGWRDRQLPGGTVVWTAPTGRQYRTEPGSKWLFPGWDTTTAALPAAETTQTSTQRTVKMPKRRRTRDAERKTRIKAERARNQVNIAPRNLPP
jgi:hypothetical protein